MREAEMQSTVLKHSPRIVTPSAAGDENVAQKVRVRSIRSCSLPARTAALRRSQIMRRRSIEKICARDCWSRSVDTVSYRYM